MKHSVVLTLTTTFSTFLIQFIRIKLQLLSLVSLLMRYYSNESHLCYLSFLLLSSYPHRSRSSVAHLYSPSSSLLWLTFHHLRILFQLSSRRLLMSHTAEEAFLWPRNPCILPATVPLSLLLTWPHPLHNSITFNLPTVSLTWQVGRIGSFTRSTVPIVRQSEVSPLVWYRLI